jgi:hypothetical protein
MAVAGVPTSVGPDSPRSAPRPQGSASPSPPSSRRRASTWCSWRCRMTCWTPPSRSCARRTPRCSSARCGGRAAARGAARGARAARTRRPGRRARARSRPTGGVLAPTSPPAQVGANLGAPGYMAEIAAATADIDVQVPAGGGGGAGGGVGGVGSQVGQGRVAGGEGGGGWGRGPVIRSARSGGPAAPPARGNLLPAPLTPSGDLLQRRLHPVGLLLHQVGGGGGGVLAPRQGRGAEGSGARGARGASCRGDGTQQRAAARAAARGAGAAGSGCGRAPPRQAAGAAALTPHPPVTPPPRHPRAQVGGAGAGQH